MVDIKADTEQKILDAAKEEFIINGMAGARMQSIADRAGINKSLLHYYYRSKEKLFGFVFKSVFKQIFPKIETVIKSDKSLFEKIEIFVSEYIDIVMNNPFLPIFVLHELSKNPKRLIDLIQSLDIDTGIFIHQIQEAIDNESKVSIKAQHLMVNTVALSLFPVIARPLLQELVFKGSKDEYKEFMTERKTEVPKFIKNALSCTD